FPFYFLLYERTLMSVLEPFQSQGWALPEWMKIICALDLEATYQLKQKIRRLTPAGFITWDKFFEELQDQFPSANIFVEASRVVKGKKGDYLLPARIIFRQPRFQTAFYAPHVTRQGKEVKSLITAEFFAGASHENP